GKQSRKFRPTKWGHAPFCIAEIPRGRCPLMGWSGRAPAPPVTNLARGSEHKEHVMSQNLNNAVAVIGIDIGKNSFHVVGLDDRGAIALRQKWSRGQVEARLGWC